MLRQLKPLRRNPRTPSAIAQPHQSIGGGWVAWAMFALVLVYLVRASWVGDDGYILLKVVYNINHGFGPVYNVTERVLAVTCPLWMWVLSIFCKLTGEYFITTQFVCIASSALAVWMLLFRVARPWWAAVLTGAALFSSKAFMDYATSGLEVCLLNLLVASLLWVASEVPESASGRAWRLNWTILLASLIVITRQDMLLLIAPIVGMVIWRAHSRGGRPWPLLIFSVFRWSLPFTAWHVFSVIYYGFPFPNTFYAKIGVFKMSGLGKAHVLMQGFLYYLNVMEQDPVTLIVLLLGIALILKRGYDWQKYVAYGALAYMAYTFWIGGDFMAGRFLALPLLAVTPLAASLVGELVPSLGAAAAVLVLGALQLKPTYRYGTDPQQYGFNRSRFTDHYHNTALVLDHRGIADERLAYYTGASLMHSLDKEWTEPRYYWYDWGQRMRKYPGRVAIFGGAGYFGFGMGPRVHLLDPQGLADALVARLPVWQLEHNKVSWRPGHFYRRIPEGYVETLVSGRNQIKDSAIHQYYSALAPILRGPLFTAERWRRIWEMNLGQHDQLLVGHFRYPFIDNKDTLNPNLAPVMREQVKALDETNRY